MGFPFLSQQTAFQEKNLVEKSVRSNFVGSMNRYPKQTEQTALGSILISYQKNSHGEFNGVCVTCGKKTIPAHSSLIPYTGRKNLVLDYAGSWWNGRRAHRHLLHVLLTRLWWPALYRSYRLIGMCFIALQSSTRLVLVSCLPS